MSKTVRNVLQNEILVIEIEIQEKPVLISAFVFVVRNLINRRRRKNN